MNETCARKPEVSYDANCWEPWKDGYRAGWDAALETALQIVCEISIAGSRAVMDNLSNGIGKITGLMTEKETSE